jgi:hypothetical protein
MKRVILLLWLPIALLGKREEIQSGVFYETIQTKTPLVIHVVEIDPSLSYLKPAKALNHAIGLEKATSIAKRRGALVACNGTFFKKEAPYSGVPSGILKIEQALYSSSPIQRGAIAWDKKRQQFLMDRVSYHLEAKINHETYPIGQLNQPRKENELVLYTPDFHKSTLTYPKGREIQIVQKKIAAIDASQGDMSIPEMGYVLSFGPSAPLQNKPVSIGMSASITKQISPKYHMGKEVEHEWLDADYILGAGPLLVNQERVLDFREEKFSKNFLEKREAKTALGLKDNKIILVVVDGNNSRKSIGMNMIELARFMQCLGCTQALNLSGGSASTLVIENELVNEPRKEMDGEVIESKISNAILIFDKAQRS